MVDRVIAQTLEEKAKLLKKLSIKVHMYVLCVVCVVCVPCALCVLCVMCALYGDCDRIVMGL